jgi:hypothetical protein
MRGRMRATVAAASAAALLGAVVASPAPAEALSPGITNGASAYAAAAGTGTAALQANLQLSGSLGILLDAQIRPIVSQTLDPLLSALQGTVNSVVSGVLGASSSYSASTSPSQQQYSTAPAAFPTDTTPSPCLSVGSQPCFSAVSATASVPPLISTQVGAISGYAEQVMSSADATNPIFGRASVASPQVSVLPGIPTLIPGLPSIGNPLIGAGLINAKANCPNDGAPGATKPKTGPSVSLSASGVTLLGGLITLDVLNGQIANLKVNNVSYASLLSLPTLTIAGITVSQYGSAVLVSIPLSLSQILAGLGISGAVGTALTSLGLTSTLALKLIIGPNSVVTSRTATAWGLGVGVDLSGSLSFNLLNLVTASVNVPSGITGSNFGNLLDLRLANTTCQSGVVMPATTPVIPPALV